MINQSCPSAGKKVKRQKMVKALAAVRLERETPVEVWRQKKPGPPKKRSSQTKGRRGNAREREELNGTRVASKKPEKIAIQ